MDSDTTCLCFVDIREFPITMAFMFEINKLLCGAKVTLGFKSTEAYLYKSHTIKIDKHGTNTITLSQSLQECHLEIQIVSRHLES